jgi:hypothetical protein
MSDVLDMGSVKFGAFDWNDINGRDLKIAVAEDKDNNAIMVVGYDIQDNTLYILHYKQGKNHYV